MSHGATEELVKGVGRNGSKRGWRVILRTSWLFKVLFYFIKVTVVPPAVPLFWCIRAFSAYYGLEPDIKE